MGEWGSLPIRCVNPPPLQARKEGNLVKSRFSVTLPHAAEEAAAAAAAAAGAAAAGGARPQTGQSGENASTIGAMAGVAAAGGGAAAVTPKQPQNPVPQRAAGAPVATAAAAAGGPKGALKPAGRTAAAAGAAARDVWGPDSIRHTNVGTIYGSDAGGFSRQPPTTIGEVAPIVGSSSVSPTRRSRPAPPGVGAGPLGGGSPASPSETAAASRKGGRDGVALLNPTSPASR